jgi:hypothetical protein
MSFFQSLLRLFIILLFSNSSRAVDPRILHDNGGHTRAEAPSMGSGRFRLRDESGATRPDTLGNEFRLASDNDPTAASATKYVVAQ